MGDITLKDNNGDNITLGVPDAPVTNLEDLDTANITIDSAVSSDIGLDSVDLPGVTLVEVNTPDIIIGTTGGSSGSHVAIGGSIAGSTANRFLVIDSTNHLSDSKLEFNDAPTIVGPFTLPTYLTRPVGWTAGTDPAYGFIDATSAGSTKNFVLEPGTGSVIIVNPGGAATFVASSTQASMKVGAANRLVNTDGTGFTEAANLEYQNKTFSFGGNDLPVDYIIPSTWDIDVDPHLIYLDATLLGGGHIAGFRVSPTTGFAVVDPSIPAILASISDGGLNLQYGVAVNEVTTDNTFASASDTQLATSLAIKDYVDNSLSGGGVFLPLAGGTLTGNLNIQESANHSLLDIVRDSTTYKAAISFTTGSGPGVTDYWRIGLMEGDNAYRLRRVGSLDVMVIDPDNYEMAYEGSIRIHNGNFITNREDFTTTNELRFQTGGAATWYIGSGTIDDTFYFSNGSGTIAAYIDESTVVFNIGKLQILASFDAGNKRLETVADPVNPQDAATKVYADNIYGGTP